MEINILSEVRYIIKNYLDVKLEIDEIEGRKIINVDLKFDGQAFSGHYIYVDELLKNEPNNSLHSNRDKFP